MKTLVLELIAFLKNSIYWCSNNSIYNFLNFLKIVEQIKMKLDSQIIDKVKITNILKKLNRKKMKVENDINARTNKKTKNKGIAYY